MRHEKTLLELFDLGLVIKAIDGALEMLGALLVVLVPPAFIVRVVEVATAGELSNDPDDPLATALRDAAHSFALHTHALIAAYLFLHGIIKVLLVLGIFRGYRLAYPLFIIALGVFGSYEAYRGVLTHNLLLDALALVDLAMVILTAHEYRLRRIVH